MRRITTKPFLLLATLALVAAAILFLETRFDTASPESGTTAQTTETVSEPPEDSEMVESSEMSEDTRMAEEEAPDPTGDPAMTEGAGEAENGETTEEPGEEAPDPNTERIAEKEAEYDRAHEIVGPTGYINTDGITIGENLGDKVILVDFWTYSCFNCQNTQPYLNAWQEEYADDGLVIIGVHKPEFEFEKDYAGVAEAVELAGITYPVVLDNNDATWDAYDQRFWPTMYLVDSDGFIRYKHIGEGAYDETEAKIQELLAERDRIGGGS